MTTYRNVTESKMYQKVGMKVWDRKISEDLNWEVLVHLEIVIRYQMGRLLVPLQN